MTSGAPKFDSFYGYNGEETNPVIGRQYLRARYYDADKGRFDVADTYLGSLTDPLTLNRYSYTMNNPVMRIDPSGHWPGWLDQAANTVKKGVNTVKNWVSEKVVKPVVSTVKSAASWVNEKVASPAKNVVASVNAGIRAGSGAISSGSASKKLRQTLSAAGKGLAGAAGITGSVQLGAGRGSATYVQMKAQEAMQKTIQMQCESGETLDNYTQGQNQAISDYWSGVGDSLVKNLLTDQFITIYGTAELITQWNLNDTEALEKQLAEAESFKINTQVVDKEEYYRGRVHGDLLSMVLSVLGMVGGAMAAGGGTGITIGSGGTAGAVGVPVAIGGVVLLGYSGAVGVASAKSMAGDWDKYQEEKGKASENATGESSNERPGTWKKSNEKMSDASKEYQKFITGADEGMVYEVNGVKFDGYKDGVLIEAKGDYSGFVDKNNGQFFEWFQGKDSLVSQAQRQINAANGTKVQWYFNDSISMQAVENLFSGQIDGIEFILKPMG